MTVETESNLVEVMAKNLTMFRAKLDSNPSELADIGGTIATLQAAEQSVCSDGRMNASVIASLDLMMDYDDISYENEVEHKSADEILIESLNKFGAVDISYIAQGAGISTEKATL